MERKYANIWTRMPLEMRRGYHIRHPCQSSILWHRIMQTRYLQKSSKPFFMKENGRRHACGKGLCEMPFLSSENCIKEREREKEEMHFRQCSESTFLPCSMAWHFHHILHRSDWCWILQTYDSREFKKQIPDLISHSAALSIALNMMKIEATESMKMLELTDKALRLCVLFFDLELFF